MSSVTDFNGLQEEQRQEMAAGILRFELHSNILRIGFVSEDNSSNSNQAAANQYYAELRRRQLEDKTYRWMTRGQGAAGGMVTVRNVNILKMALLMIP